MLGTDYFVKVRVQIDSNIASITCREIVHHISGEILLAMWDKDEQIVQTKIGYISSFRAFGSNLSAIRVWSDSGDQDLYEAFNWLLEEKFFPTTDLMIDEVLCDSPILLDRVFIEPEWRSHGFALPAVATFLDLLRAVFVFLIPAPFDKTLSEEERTRQRKLLCRYWRRLGFVNYDSQKNVLWTERWECPEWLRGNDRPD